MAGQPRKREIRDPKLRNLMAARCTVCRQYFASDSAFCDHRYTDANGVRRCLTPAQMDGLGMVNGARGLRLGAVSVKSLGYDSIEAYANATQTAQNALERDGKYDLVRIDHAKISAAFGVPAGAVRKSPEQTG